MAESLGDAVLQLTTRDVQFQRGVDQAEQRARQMDQTFARTGSSITRGFGVLSKTLGDLGRFAARQIRNLTIALGAGAVAATKFGADFEQSMSRIVGLVGVSAEQVAAWRQDILQLAPELGRSPQQLADAMFFITSAGLRGAEAMDALVASTKGSVAGLGEIEVIADLATSAMNAYGAENVSAAQAVDVLTATVREGKAAADEIAGSIGTVIPLAAEMGVEFAEVGGVVSALTRIGFDASKSVTSLQAILSQLLNPAQQASDVLASVGMSAEGLRKAVREEGLFVALNELYDALDRDATQLAKVLPNVEALRGALGLLGSNAEETEKIMRSLGDSAGATESAFGTASRTITETFKRALENLRAPLTRIGEVLGTIGAGLAETLSVGIGQVLNRFAGWLERNASTIYAVFTNIPTIAAEAFGVVAAIIKRTFEPQTLQATINALMEFIVDRFVDMIKQLPGLLYESIKLVTSIPQALVQKTGNIFQRLLARLPGGKDIEDVPKETLQQILAETFTENISGLLDQIKITLREAATDVASTAGKIGASYADILAGFKTTIAGTLEASRMEFEEFNSTISATGESTDLAGEELAGAIDSAIDGLDGLSYATGNLVQDFVAFTPGTRWREELSGSIYSASETISAVEEAFSTAATAGQAVAISLINLLFATEGVRRIMELFDRVVMQPFEGLASFIGSILIPVLEFLEGPLRSLGRFFARLGGAISWVVDWIKYAFARLSGERPAKPMSFVESLDRYVTPEMIGESSDADYAMAAGATYQQQRPINISIDVHDNQVYGGSLREFAVLLRDELQALGELHR